MRTLFRASLSALVGAALLDCSAEARDGLDAGALDGSTPGDAGVDAPDVGSDRDVTDAGACSVDAWCRTPLPDDELQLTAVWSFGLDDAVAATTTNLLRWNGAAWTANDGPDARGPTSLWASGPNDVWGVTQGGHRLVHGTRAASGLPFTWSKIEFDGASSPTMDVIRGVGPSDLWVRGTLFGQNVIQHGVITAASDGDGGSVTTVRSWTTIPIPFETLRSVGSFWVTPNHEIWIAGPVDDGISSLATIVRGTPSTQIPGSYSWAEVLRRPPGGYLGFTAMWGEGTNDLWAAGDNRESVHATIAGGGAADWTVAPIHANGDVTGIWGSGRNDVWLVGRAGAVRHWDGATWRISRLAVGGLPLWTDLSCVHGGPGGDVWAVGRGVALHHLPTLGGTP